MFFSRNKKKTQQVGLPWNGIASQASQLSVIPDSVTSIGQRAFQNCTGLTEINVSASVTSIGAYAFNACSSITNISFSGSTSQWNSMSRSQSWKNNVPATVVHCSDGDAQIWCPMFPAKGQRQRNIQCRRNLFDLKDQPLENKYADSTQGVLNNQQEMMRKTKCSVTVFK